MKINFKNIILSLFCFAFISSVQIHCKFDELNFDDDIDYSALDFDELDTYQTRAGTNDLMAAMLDTSQELKAPLWKSTRPPKGRDTLYLLPHKLTAIEHGGFALNLFFNYTANMGFSTEETLKLSENARFFEILIDELVRVVQAKEASSLIPLFKKLTIQERKAGALLQAGFITGPFTIQLNTSMQISERNFWLNKKDQQQIKNIFKDTGGSFDENELYKIRYGLGDTRIKTGLNTLNTSSFQLDVGFEGIIPTSKISNLPNLNNLKINLDNITNSISELLGSVRDNMITPQLGNNGHYGLGCYVESKVALFHSSIHLWNRLSFDNLFSAQEDRLIPSKQTMLAPADDINFVANVITPLLVAPPDDGPATQFIKEYLFPPPYRVTVQPGGILNFVSTISLDLSKKWSMGIGYDFYFQQAERFEKIHNDDAEENSLRIEDAQSKSALQHKVFSEVNYLKKQRRWDLNLGFGADYTISSERIGHDWTIFVRLGASF